MLGAAWDTASTPSSCFFFAPEEEPLFVPAVVVTVWLFVLLVPVVVLSPVVSLPIAAEIAVR